MRKVLLLLVTLFLMGGFFSTAAFAEEKPAATPTISKEDAAALMTKMNGAMDKVGGWVESTEQFAVAQAPLLVQEILYWEIAFQAFLVSLGIFMMSYALWGWRWSYREGKKHLLLAEQHKEVLQGERDRMRQSRYGTEDAIFSFTHYAIPVSAAILGVVGVIMFLVNIPGLIKPLVAPRLFLIEYFRAFVSATHR
jgi:hypothetical protein